MSLHMPEDLSDLPDPACEPEGDSEPGWDKLPENVSNLPDGPSDVVEPVEESEPTAWTNRLWELLVGAIVAFALLLVILEVREVLSSAVASDPTIGWPMVITVAAVVLLVGLIVLREVRGYARLASFERMRDVFEKMREDPTDRQNCSSARRELEHFLAYQENTEDSEVLVRVERFRECMALADDPVEWREDLERVMLKPMDDKVRAVIRREAINVGIGTALSPYGFLDALVTIWRNVRLTKRIASIYRVRAGSYGTYLILRRAIVSAALADLAQEAAVTLIAARSIGSRVAAPVAQGLANAALTMRVGFKAQEQCRPLMYPPDERNGWAKSLIDSISSTVKNRTSDASTEDGD